MQYNAIPRYSTRGAFFPSRPLPPPSADCLLRVWNCIQHFNSKFQAIDLLLIACAKYGAFDILYNITRIRIFAVST